MNRLAGATIIRVPKREGLTHHEDVVRIQGVMEAHVDKMRSEVMLVTSCGTCREDERSCQCHVVCPVTPDRAIYC